MPPFMPYLKNKVLSVKDSLKNFYEAKKWSVTFSNNTLNDYFSTARQEATFMNYLSSVNFTKIKAELTQVENTFKNTFANRVQTLDNLFPEKEKETKKIPGEMKTFHDVLKHQPSDTPAIAQAKKELNAEFNKIVSKEAKVLIDNGERAISFDVEHVFKKEIDRLKENIEKIEGNAGKDDIEPFLRQDFLHGLRSHLNQLKKEGMDALIREHRKEEKEFASTFLKNEGVKDNLRQVFNLGGDSKDDLPKAFSNSLESTLKETHQNELKEFEKSFNNQLEALEKKINEEMYRLSLIQYLQEQGHPKDKARIQSLIEQNAVSSVGGETHSSNLYKNINVKDLNSFQAVKGVELTYHPHNNSFTAALSGNPDQMRDAMHELVKNIYSTGSSDSISLNLTMDDTKKGEAAARQLYLVCLQHGYDPEKIKISVNGANVTEKDKKGKIQLVAKSPGFEQEIESYRSRYQQRQERNTQSSGFSEKDSAREERYTDNNPRMR